MMRQLYSVDQVAALLGLHVKTVRNYVRDGRLKATRVGKQYRIARDDLEAFTGTPSGRPDGTRRVEASTIVQIDGLDTDGMSRLSTVLISWAGGADGAEGSGGAGRGVRVQTVYDLERASMKIILIGGPAATADLLRIIDDLVGQL
ncbi:MAG: helix-turn-helix domain-containing protein [Labedaea sp.]